jgi:hypothetical protein
MNLYFAVLPFSQVAMAFKFVSSMPQRTMGPGVDGFGRFGRGTHQNAWKRSMADSSETVQLSEMTMTDAFGYGSNRESERLDAFDQGLSLVALARVFYMEPGGPKDEGSL